MARWRSITTLSPYTPLFRSVAAGVSVANLSRGQDQRNQFAADHGVVGFNGPADTDVGDLARQTRLADFRQGDVQRGDRKSTRLNSSPVKMSYAALSLRKQHA